MISVIVEHIKIKTEIIVLKEEAVYVKQEKK
jgi:hypothetical protein